MKVLLVEDDPLIRLGMAGLIEDWNYAVLEAGNADEAAKLLERHSDIALVISDVDMPGSMDGLKLAHFIRHRWPPIPVILVSGKAAIDTGNLPLRTLFFSKPVRDAVLHAAAQSLLAPRAADA